MIGCVLVYDSVGEVFMLYCLRFVLGVRVYTGGLMCVAAPVVCLFLFTWVLGLTSLF